MITFSSKLKLVLILVAFAAVRANADGGVLAGVDLFKQQPVVKPSATAIVPAKAASVPAPDPLASPVDVSKSLPVKRLAEPLQVAEPLQAKPVHKIVKKKVHKKHTETEDDTYYDFSPGKKVVPKEAGDPLSLPLPGVGTVQGSSLLNKSAIIRVNGDGTEVIEVSNQFQNRISTPYDSPKVIDASGADIKVLASSIYVSVIGKPIAIYISGSHRNDPVISLTLVPKPIPAQSIVLQLDQPLVERTATKKNGKPETYEQTLAETLKTVAMGSSPEGFSTGKIDNIVGRKGPLAIMPLSRFSNAYQDVFSYRVMNLGAKTERLSESSFYVKGVLAVGMFPVSTLRPKETTFVYVVSDKSALGASYGK